MNIFISIVIPVYNTRVELFEKAINSVLAINVPIEIIVVDDGSKNSFSISYKNILQDFPQIHYFYKKNEGVSIARNYGISVSKGKYLLFLDADDEISPEYAKFISGHFHEINAEWVLCGVKVLNVADGNIVNRDIFEISELKTNNQSALCDVDLYDLIKIRVSTSKISECWGKLILRSIVVENQISFPEGVTIGEDLVFNTRLMKVVNSIQYIPVYGYCYKMMPRSADRVSAESYKRFEHLHERKQELDALINARVNEAFRGELFLLQNIELIKVIVGDCITFYNAGILNVAMKAHITDWVLEIEVLKNVSFMKCKGVKAKIYYLIIKYHLWYIISFLARLHKIFNK